MCVSECALHVPEGAEMVELYGWFPGTMQPFAPGKMSGGGRRRWGETEADKTESISHCGTNYRVGGL